MTLKQVEAEIKQQTKIMQDADKRLKQLFVIREQLREQEQGQLSLF